MTWVIDRPIESEEALGIKNGGVKSGHEEYVDHASAGV